MTLLLLKSSPKKVRKLEHVKAIFHKHKKYKKRKEGEQCEAPQKLSNQGSSKTSTVVLIA